MDGPPMDGLPFERYGEALGDYLKTQREQALYQASLLSQIFVEQRAGPDEIVALHFESLDQLLRGMSYREHARAVTDAHQFLLEVMIAYGVTYREYLDLKMRESERDATAREEILATIAHELRSPITAAKGHLDLATRHLARGQVELLPPRIATARGALDRLSRLTSNLVRSGQNYSFTLTMELVDLVAVMHQACEWAQVAADEKSIQVAQDTHGPGSLLVSGDADALLSVFGNLLSNAIRYSPEGGRVLLRHGVETDMAWVEVEDHGIGMSAEVQARIFDKFYRGPDARAVEAQGLGLGLTLVNQAVQAHQGTVGVRSEEGVGSVFRVTLPVANSTECGGPAQAMSQEVERV